MSENKESDILRFSGRDKRKGEFVQVKMYKHVESIFRVRIFGSTFDGRSANKDGKLLNILQAFANKGKLVS